MKHKYMLVILAVLSQTIENICIKLVVTFRDFTQKTIWKAYSGRNDGYTKAIDETKTCARNIYILNIFRGNLRETVHGTNLFRF